MSLRVTSRRRLGGAVAALTALAAVTLFASPARAAGNGYVRLAHLSPDTPAVDVYLKSTADAIKAQTFRGVGYGAMSQYLRLPVGMYQVAMRKAGAPASTKPVLTTEVGVENGAAYTVAGVGRFADLGLRVLNDDLKLPDPGKSKVRVIQASVKAPVLDVAGTNGETIAEGVEFATTTPYQEVEPGRWSVQVQPTGGGKTSCPAVHARRGQRLLAGRAGRQPRGPEATAARRRRTSGHGPAGRRRHRRRRQPARVAPADRAGVRRLGGGGRGRFRHRRPAAARGALTAARG